MNRHPSISNLVLAVAASLVVFGGVLASEASAHGWARGRTVVVARPRAHVTYVVHRYRPASWVFARPAPVWCSDGRYVEFEGSPYWYNVGLGIFFGGADVNVSLGNAPPRGYGYWDPCDHAWVTNLRAYQLECKRFDRPPTLQVVRVETRPGWRRW